MLSGKSEVGQQLRFMDRQEEIDGFDFHDKTFFDEQVKPKPVSQFNGLEIERYRFLSLDCQTA